MDIGTLLPILGGTFILVATWAIIISSKKKIIMLLLIPFLSATGVYSYLAINEVLGYPVNEVMSKDSQYVYHLVNKSRTKIFIWSIHEDDDEPRAYEIPYNKEDEKKLENSKQRQNLGIPQMIKGSDKKDGNDKMLDTTKGSLKLYDYDMSNEISK